MGLSPGTFGSQALPDAVAAGSPLRETWSLHSSLCCPWGPGLVLAHWWVVQDPGMAGCMAHGALGLVPDHWYTEPGPSMAGYMTQHNMGLVMDGWCVGPVTRVADHTA